MILLLVSFFLFLFSLYILSHDDFVMLRKNVTVEQIFNIAILTGFISLFFARLVFVLFHFNSGFLNPLVFFLFWYFPGLSLAGGILGGITFLLYYASSRKLPVARLFDFFSFSLLAVLPFSTFVTFLFAQNKARLVELIIFLLYAIIFLIFIFFFLPRYRKATIKEGSLGQFALLFICIVALTAEFLQKNVKIFSIFTLESFLFIGMILVIGFYILKREKIIARGQRGRRNE